MVRLLTAVILLSAVAVAQPRSTKPKASAPAQGSADLSQPYRLAEIQVQGNNNFEANEVIGLSGLKKGQNVNKADFDAAQKRLLETGLFETVAYRFEPIPGQKAYRATLEVKEIEQLFPYRFEALGSDEEAMRNWLRKAEPLYMERIPATEPVLEKLAKALEEYLVKAGRPMPVIGKLMPDAKNRLEVVFQPSSLPSVAEVQFTGSKAIPNQALQQAVAGAAIGALYTENRFRQILDASIRPLFEAEGRLRVSFPKFETKPAADVKGLIVTVHVNEGDTYKLRGVDLAGPLAENKSLLKEGSFRTGQVANMTAVQEGLNNIERSLRRNGYMKIDSRIDRKIDDKEKTVDVVLNIDPGPRYKMGKLFIEGLDIQTEPHIRELWALKANQPFDYEYPDFFLSKMPEYLDNLGKTKSLVKSDPGTLEVDVTLLFEGDKKPEKPPIP